MADQVLDFWFDFASTYSYPAAMRDRGAGGTAGVSVRFRPFLLGPIFKAQGWASSPFNIYPAKGRNMWRDLERLCARPVAAVPPARSVSAIWSCWRHASRWLGLADDGARRFAGSLPRQFGRADGSMTRR